MLHKRGIIKSALMASFKEFLLLNRRLERKLCVWVHTPAHTIWISYFVTFKTIVHIFFLIALQTWITITFWTACIQEKRWIFFIQRWKRKLNVTYLAQFILKCFFLNLRKYRIIHRKPPLKRARLQNSLFKISVIKTVLLGILTLYMFKNAHRNFEAG